MFKSEHWIVSVMDSLVTIIFWILFFASITYCTMGSLPGGIS